MAILTCPKCAGEGRIHKSRYGGNDPDTWDAGECEFCHGSGSQPCEVRTCKETAVAFNDEGEAMCADCLAEWMVSAFGDGT